VTDQSPINTQVALGVKPASTVDWNKIKQVEQIISPPQPTFAFNPLTGK